MEDRSLVSGTVGNASPLRLEEVGFHLDLDLLLGALESQQKEKVVLSNARRINSIEERATQHHSQSTCDRQPGKGENAQVREREPCLPQHPMRGEQGQQHPHTNTSKSRPNQIKDPQIRQCKRRCVHGGRRLQKVLSVPTLQSQPESLPNCHSRPLPSLLNLVCEPPQIPQQECSDVMRYQNNHSEESFPAAVQSEFHKPLATTACGWPTDQYEIANSKWYTDATLPAPGLENVNSNWYTEAILPAPGLPFHAPVPEAAAQPRLSAGLPPHHQLPSQTQGKRSKSRDIHRRSRSRSRDKNRIRSRSRDKGRRSRSRSRDKYRRSRSRSRDKYRRSRSRSRDKHRRSRSRSIDKHRRSRSRSRDKYRRSRSRSIDKHRRSKSRSRNNHGRSRPRSRDKPLRNRPRSREKDSSNTRDKHKMDHKRISSPTQEPVSHSKRLKKWSTSMDSQTFRVKSVNQYLRLYVGNLHPEKIAEDTLHKIFIKYGEIRNIKMIKDFETGCSLGFGFVTFRCVKDGEAALRKENGRVVEGRKMKVELSTSSSHKDAGRGPGFTKGHANILLKQLEQFITEFKPTTEETQDTIASRQRWDPAPTPAAIPAPEPDTTIASHFSSSQMEPQQDQRVLECTPSPLPDLGQVRALRMKVGARTFSCYRVKHIPSAFVWLRKMTEYDHPAIWSIITGPKKNVAMGKWLLERTRPAWWTPSEPNHWTIPVSRLY